MERNSAVSKAKSGPTRADGPSRAGAMPQRSSPVTGVQDGGSLAGKLSSEVSSTGSRFWACAGRAARFAGRFFFAAAFFRVATVFFGAGRRAGLDVFFFFAVRVFAAAMVIPCVGKRNAMV